MEVLEKIAKAEQHVFDLCEGRAKWTMRVPVDEEKDSDCIIMAALTAAREAIEPLNKVVEDGQADCAIESGCKRRIKGWGCYDNCRSYTPAT